MIPNDDRVPSPALQAPTPIESAWRVEAAVDWPRGSAVSWPLGGQEDVPPPTGIWRTCQVVVTSPTPRITAESILWDQGHRWIKVLHQKRLVEVETRAAELVWEAFQRAKHDAKRGGYHGEDQDVGSEPDPE
jgi:hypothetical protein